MLHFVCGTAERKSSRITAQTVGTPARWHQPQTEDHRWAHRVSSNTPSLLLFISPSLVISVHHCTPPFSLYSKNQRLGLELEQMRAEFAGLKSREHEKSVQLEELKWVCVLFRVFSYQNTSGTEVGYDPLEGGCCIFRQKMTVKNVVLYKFFRNNKINHFCDCFYKILLWHLNQGLLNMVWGFNYRLA